MRNLLSFLFAVNLCISGKAQIPSTLNAISSLERDIPVLMQKADIPGLSAALIRNGKLTWVQSFGVMNADTKQPVTNNTIFEAASLSKVVFAYGVMKLMDEGKIDIDKPLNSYLGNNYEVGDDKRLMLITARRVLSHTSGFPNWRKRDAKTLPIEFTPGEKFSYSGEGFVYLSRVVEKITGLALEDFMQQYVLVPLGMQASSYIWQPRFNTLAVHRHDQLGKVTSRNEEKYFNAAASLRTTAEDYAKFVIALMKGEGLKTATWKQMLTPQINVNKSSPEVFWGLGVGLEQTPAGTNFWHWGDQGDSKAYVTADVAHQNAVVYFANSANGLSINSEILADAIGGSHPGIPWLGYERYNSASRRLFKQVSDGNFDQGWAAYQAIVAKDSTQKLTEAQMNSLGYQLMSIKRMDAALIVLEKNTIDFPGSPNAWDSFAEANCNNGNKELAIRYYEKVLQLDPNAANAKDWLKRLKAL